MSTLYIEFLNWAERIGLEFPCTEDQFRARAAEFVRQYQLPKNDFDHLCQQSID